MIDVNKIPTPELDKLHEVKEDSQTIGEFLDWLTTERLTPIELCVQNRASRLRPCNIDITGLLSEYFEIDKNKAEEERLALLKAIRENQDTCKNAENHIKSPL